jgi:uncharacterized membrane protein YkoI
LALSLLAGLALACPPAVAADGDRDHDVARDLYQRGEIRPLADIVALVHAMVPGDIVSVDLMQAGSSWVYRFQVIAADGQRSIVDVDAKAGTILAGDGSR